MRKQLIVPLLSASLLLAGCSQNKVNPKEYSGFLRNYDQLSEHKTASGDTVLRWVSPKLRMERYSQVYIAPSQFYPMPKASTRIPETTLKAVTTYYDTALKRELGKVLNLVEQPGPHTLIVRPAITSVGAHTQALHFYEYLPVTLVAAGVSSAVGIRDLDSVIATEAAFLDGGSRAVVAEVVRKGTGLPLENDNQVMSADNLKVVLDAWARDWRVAAETLQEQKRSAVTGQKTTAP
ncbi:DUF3313 domain-containing protein [Pseudomonas wadenswilerensis]|jgi:hypothetical protein|uniref:Putative lipoprotein n=1 Tax=Pseudomonas wadenswilerensis TaxID=1785161 RepID=A0A380T343_9PSED|nr:MULTISPECIES: DUF3313 domain-containing protein [Pseudomonas]MCE5981636.1 DUF3313 domain-containing protein [Pseudomonas sp. LF19]UVM20011.1 DUF3313 domain-containing protein [Pseudomonas wadenswilerensis]SPO66976.1 conserved exported protein of unknown function [Pseudomonas sp. JV241A]SUQ64000.1 putative lipoprotein [Pseudomonas wadenswilerensis]